MEKPKNIKQFDHIGALMETVLDGVKKSIGQGLIQVWNHWEDAVGPVISEQTKPAAMKENLLLVHVADSAWLQELQYVKADMIQSINQTVGEAVVEDIKFKIGPV